MSERSAQISIVLPAYNEASNLPRILESLSAEAAKRPDLSFQYVIVDDGSTDNSHETVDVLAKRHPDVCCIALTRNFGKEAAILAGLSEANGDAAIVMDSDLQHPPALIPSMISLWEEGFLVVNAAKRSRGRESFLYKAFSRLFYAIFYSLTKIDIRGQSDFKLLDRKVIDAYCDMGEVNRFFRATIAYLGYRTADVTFDVEDRESGGSSWSTYRLFTYSVNALTNFSSAPLHFISVASIMVLIAATILSCVALYRFFQGTAIEGFTTVIIITLVLGSIIMFALGQLGIYVEKIFYEVKRRPSYVVDEERSLKGKRTQDGEH